MPVYFHTFLAYTPVGNRGASQTKVMSKVFRGSIISLFKGLGIITSPDISTMDIITTEANKYLRVSRIVLSSAVIPKKWMGRVRYLGDTIDYLPTPKIHILKSGPQCVDIWRWVFERCLHHESKLVPL